MDKLKRTLSFRKRKDHIPESSKKSPWDEDASKVRLGTCSFQVRYLGCIEVFESRGMTVCEEACKALRTRAHRSMWSRMSIRQKKKKKTKEGSQSQAKTTEESEEEEQSKGKYQRAILYVSGEALRVVDEINKGLILDQTIEKVSFCAPDPHNVKGFSYICRDGTSRRWMCHGFMAVKDSGERLSHAVGVAFTVCLEKKQEREKDAVSVAFNEKGTSFTRTGSFRQATLTERLEDPQSAIVAEPVPQKHIFNPYAVQRPHAKDTMLERQGSFRGFTKLSESSPFKRQLSLRLNELPSTLDRQKQVLNQQSSVDNGFSPIPEASPSKEDVDSIAAMCQEVSHGLNALAAPPHNNVQNFQHTSSIPVVQHREETTVSGNNPWATTSSSIAESWLASSATVAASPTPFNASHPHGGQSFASPPPNPATRAPHLAEVRSHSLDSSQVSQQNGSSAAAVWPAAPSTAFDPFDAAWAASGRPTSTNPFQKPDNVTTAFKVNL